MQISIFNFNHNQVRIQFLNNEPYFCLADVAAILEIQNTKQSRFNLKENGVHKLQVATAGGNQEMTFINEPNLYRVIFRSNKPEAVKFQDWIFEEVIPQIRTTGSYTLKLTPAQKQQIQSAVNRRVHRTGETHQNIYRAIHELAQVSSYHDIAATDFERVMAFLQSEKVSGSLQCPSTPKGYFELLAKMTNYAKIALNYQQLLCEQPDSKEAQRIFNHFSYSVNVNHTGFLFVFKPDIEHDIQAAYDWLHAQAAAI